MADERDIFKEAEEAEKAIKKLKEAGKTVSEIRKELDGFASDALEKAKGFGSAGDAVVEVLEKELAARDKILKSVEKQAEKQRQEIKTASTRAEQNEAKRKLNDILIKQLEQKLEFENKNSEKAEEYEAQLKNLNKENERLIKNTKEYEKALKDMNERFDSFSSMLKNLASGDFFGSINKGVKILGGAVENFIKTKYSELYAKVKTANYDMTGSFMKLNEAYQGLDGASFGEKFKNLFGGIREKISGAYNSVGDFISRVRESNISTGSMGTGLMNAAKSAGQMVAQYGAMTVAMGTFLAASAAIIAVLAAMALAIGAVMVLAKFTLELENSARELTKVTGLSKNFAHAMHQNAGELRTMGIEAKDINAAVTSLNATFTNFSMLTTSTAKKVTDTTAVLGKLGMSADDTSKGFQALTKGMGQTPDAAADTMVAMDALARDLGVSTSKIGADFAGAASHLQKLSGPEALQAFKQLSVVSKATGIEVSRLLAITEKFDTFEGAATQAGKLNAALGGNFVNAMELMTATNPAERFEMIRDSILDSGLAFDEMSYYQKKFFADSMGMADVGELALAMSGDFSAVNSELGKTQADYEAAAERAKSFQSVQDQLKNSFYQLLPVVTPLLEKLNEFTDEFTKFVEQNKDEVQDVFRDLGDIMITLADTFVGLVPVMSVILKLFAGIIQAAIFMSEKLGLLAVLNFAFKDSMTKKRSPSLLDATEVMGDNLKTINVEARMGTANISGIGDATARAAMKTRTAAPIIANSTAIRNAATSTTVNNNGGGGETKINIKFDNKKMAGLFDVQVEKSLGRAARNAVIGGR